MDLYFSDAFGNLCLTTHTDFTCRYPQLQIEISNSSGIIIRRSLIADIDVCYNDSDCWNIETEGVEYWTVHDKYNGEFCIYFEE